MDCDHCGQYKRVLSVRFRPFAKQTPSTTASSERGSHIRKTRDQLGSAQIAGLFYDARDHTVAEGVGGDLLSLGDQLLQIEDLVAQSRLPLHDLVQLRGWTAGLLRCSIKGRHEPLHVTLSGVGEQDLAWAEGERRERR
jgi:hypothetical protein